MCASRFGVPIFLIAACGPETKEPADLDRVCGHESPFRILELDDDRDLVLAGQWHRVDERRILGVADFVSEDEIFGPPAGDLEYWSVDECGESPLRLDPIDSLRTLDHWPDLLFDLRNDGGLEIVDPLGEQPRNRVLPTIDTWYSETPWGLVDIVPTDETTGALVLLPFPDDPWTQTATATTLLDPIRISTDDPHSGPAEHEVLAVHDDEVFALRPSAELVRFSLLDGQTNVEATNVYSFEVSEDASWIAWQDVVPVGGDAWGPLGAIFVRERDSGTTYELPPATLHRGLSSALAFIDQEIVLLDVGDGKERVYRIPSLEMAVLPSGYSVMEKLDDGRWLAFDWLRGGAVFFDPVDGSVAPYVDAPSSLARPHADGFEVLRGLPGCCIERDERAQAPLWFFGFDGARHQIADRVTEFYDYLSDGRLLTPLDADGKWRADLVVVDVDDMSERVVDDHVLFLNPAIEDDDTIVYGVADHERTGVWLARLAPEE